MKLFIDLSPGIKGASCSILPNISLAMVKVQVISWGKNQLTLTTICDYPIIDMYLQQLVTEGPNIAEYHQGRL